MIAWLFRFRGEGIALWGLGAILLGWPPHGEWLSLPLLAAGLALRIWARRHIGPHSRGRILLCPETSVSGPYRYLDHPLYLANLLVIASLAVCLSGWSWPVVAILSGPTLLYLLLARAETAFVAKAASSVRIVSHDARSGRWHSEWASTCPQIALWGILQFLSTR